MGMDDLSYLEALMGGAQHEASAVTGAVWMVSPDGLLGDPFLRLVGKARVVADALGCQANALVCGPASSDAGLVLFQAGADRVLRADGQPDVADLAAFFRPRIPRAILFARTAAGRILGPGLAEALGGGLAGCAADLALNPMSGRIVAYQPILEDEARVAVTITASPAICVMDTAALPAPFAESWRTGEVEETRLVWREPAEYALSELPAPPCSLRDAPIVVAGGRGLRSASEFELARRLARTLGGSVAGDRGALDAGWIGEEELVGLTGQSVSPKLYLALGIRGDSEHLMAVDRAKMIVAVQPDPEAPIVQVADWNVLADPGEFAKALVECLAEQAQRWEATHLT